MDTRTCELMGFIEGQINSLKRKRNTAGKLPEKWQGELIAYEICLIEIKAHNRPFFGINK